MQRKYLLLKFNDNLCAVLDTVAANKPITHYKLKS
ncbi:MAG: hypothetical protein ACFWTY_16090 [Shouchella clausii]|jgi:hypothetical protein